MRKADSVKRSKLDTNGQTFANIKAALDATYVVSLRIAKCKKPHTIGEKLVLTCTKDILRLMLVANAVNKLSSQPLSDNTVQRRIEKCQNIKHQVVG